MVTMGYIDNEKESLSTTLLDRTDYLNSCLKNKELSCAELLEHACEAMILSSKISDIELKKELLTNIMKAYEYVDQYKMALEPLNILMSLSEDSDDISEKARCLKDMGIVNLKMGNLDKAIEFNIKALKAYQKIGDNEMIAVINGHIGVSYFQMKNYEKFLFYSDEAVKLLRKRGPSKKMSTFLNNKGSALAYLDRLDEALDCFKESLDIREKLNFKKGILSIYFNMGGIYKDKKDFDNARLYYFKAKKLSEELGNPVGIAKSSQHLGVFYKEFGEYKKAVKCMEKALKIFLERSLKPDACTIYEELSNAYVELGDYKKAVDVYRNYLILHKEVFDESLSKKLSEMQVEFDTERKIRELEILKTKNEELTRMNELLREQSITDSLTGLYNPKTLYEKLDEEIERAKRQKSPLAILMFDLDNFKRVNDTFGHQKGDEVLESIGKIIKESIRKIDIAFRYGGEEFLVIFPSMSIEKGISVVKRLRAEITKIYIEKGIIITISGGLKQWCGEKSFDYLYSVDKLLYKAKKNGKNRIEK